MLTAFCVVMDMDRNERIYGAGELDIPDFSLWKQKFALILAYSVLFYLGM